MKQNLAIIAVLLISIGALYALRTGLFEGAGDGYAGAALPEVVDYNFHIKPILSDNCYTCHGPDEAKRKAGLRLDIEAAALSELAESPGKHALVPGRPMASMAYRRIVSRDPGEAMPPPGSQLALGPREKELVRRWIAQGARFERHWAFIPPEKPDLPSTAADWGENEIDAFVLAKLEEHGLAPSKRAGPHVLLRRLALALTGLPPTAEQVRELEGDPSDATLSALIDGFLASPAYGERMAQRWLDVARYADSHGYQDDSYRTMWPWRDWVIHAFNENLPYDEFLTWQLAGDLLPDATREQVLATGFNRNHPITQEGGVIQEEYRTNYVVDRTNTLGKGILGITLECAKCHDHKYDAISQKNYFEIFAFFNQVDEKGLQMDAVQAKNQRYFADAPFITVTGEEAEGILDFINKKDGGPVNVMVMNDSAPKATFVLDRGEYDRPTDSVVPGTPPAIFPFAEDLPKNRLGLAQWVTSPDNPLTARVFVNRTWSMLFGKGLVETEEDFGVQGSLPTHPGLLDWLSRDFMENGWDVRHLLRTIVSSATYRQSSETRPELERADPENRLLARAPRFRMSGEMIRDYVLASSGLLNREVGGPSVKPYQPAGLWEETNAGGDRGILTNYVPDTGGDLYRRSLYTFWKRTLPPPNMTIFDAPTRDFSEVRRQKTNTPLQALVLQNDVQVLEAARVLAQRMVAGSPDGPGPVEDLFRRILVRPPKERELLTLEGYYHDALETYRGDIAEAGKLVSVGEYEQLGTDPARTAALMLTAQVIYNLDETITIE